MYGNPVGLTCQFRFCGNPFRIDVYKGCDFGCQYCFANSRQYKGSTGGEQHDGGEKFDECDPAMLERMFYRSFETDAVTTNITIELMRRRVPLHFGGLSDPFQTREWSLGLSKKLIELTVKYKYPMMMSTKAAWLPDDYMQLLDKDIHAMQVSLMGMDYDFIRKYETHTPHPRERADFIKLLHGMGIFATVRIQPLVNLQQAIDVVEYLGKEVSYITVEHLKIPHDNSTVAALFREEFKGTTFYVPEHGGRNKEVTTDVKARNVAAIKAVAQAPVGVGDNDLHDLSESRCCCGIDLAGEAFQNYLKYNVTYLVTGEIEDDIYHPKGNCLHSFNGDKYRFDARKKAMRTCKEWTDEYINQYPYLFNSVPQNLKKLMPGRPVQKKLF